MIQDVSGRTLLLHIGAHKTGTTSFQSLLASSKSLLASRGIKLWESQLCLDHDCQRDLAGWAHEIPLLAVRQELRFPLRDYVGVVHPDISDKELWEHCVAQLDSAAEMVVASHENLSFVNSAEELSVISEMLSLTNRKVRVVLVRRSPSEWLASWRAQLIRMGYSPESTDTNSISYTSNDTWLVNWKATARAYQDAFAEKSVRILDYDALKENDKSVLFGLANAMGLPIPEKAIQAQPFLNVRSTSTGGPATERI